MYDQLREDTLYIMLYAAVTTTAMLTSCYLLFRRGNAIAPGVTPPARLRRWAALFLAVFALNHVWYMPIINTILKMFFHSIILIVDGQSQKMGRVEKLRAFLRLASV